MSSSISTHLDGDGCWSDLIERRHDIIHLGENSHIEIAALEGGMTSGRPSVSIRIDLPDGKVVIAEVSMRLFLASAKALEARYGAEV